MINNRRAYRRNRSTSTWAYLGLLGSFAPLAALITAPFFSQTLLDKGTSVKVENTAVVTEFMLEPRPIGALRVNADAVIPTNHWVVFEIKLVDEQGNILVSVIKEAWEESGIWQEGGESGAWREQDLKAGLDIKGKEEQKVKLLLTVLSYGTGNTELEALVSFDVQVKNGAIDTRHLWPAFIISSLLAILGLVAVPLSVQRFFNVLAVLVAVYGIFNAYSQKSAFHLGQETQPNYAPRYGTNVSGGYNSSGIWIYNSTTRSAYEGFQGGGPGVGK
ncbi:MAG: hypothetical protein AB4041_17825 [Microcystaceae cyanobacterium]